MKYLKFVTSLLLTVIVFYGLNNKFGSAPPIGKFLNPVSGIWQNEKDESVTGTVSIDGLKDKVTVHYDEQLIPHIFAENENDLYRAQGYITAKHRLWQMEFQTMAAAGRLSEFIGEAALNYDRRQRRPRSGKAGRPQSHHQCHPLWRARYQDRRRARRHAVPDRCRQRKGCPIGAARGHLRSLLSVDRICPGARLARSRAGNLARTGQENGRRPHLHLPGRREHLPVGSPGRLAQTRPRYHRAVI